VGRAIVHRPAGAAGQRSNRRSFTAAGEGAHGRAARRTSTNDCSRTLPGPPPHDHSPPHAATHRSPPR